MRCFYLLYYVTHVFGVAKSSYKQQMETKLSVNKVPRPLRRSTRHSSSNKVLGFEATPRGPLKRTKRSSGNKAPVAAVNGSREKEDDDSDDGESPSKKSRLETAGAVSSSGDGNEMEVQESCEDVEKKNKDRGISSKVEDSSHSTHAPILHQGAAGEVNLVPLVVLNERCQPYAVIKDADLKKIITEKTTKKPAAPTKPVVPVRPLVNRHVAPVSKTSIPEYQSRIKSIASTVAVPTAKGLTPGVYRLPEGSSTIHYRLNSIPIKKELVKSKKQEQVTKTKVIKTSSGYSSRGFMWHLCCLVLLMLLSSAALLAFNKLPLHKRLGGCGTHLTRVVKPEMFADQLSLLEAQFPSQRPELWKRSKIHLEKHLRTAQPTEPVSLIITAGRRAERTLHCLAQRLASSFSSALNGTVLHIDGVSKAGQDSDTVKLDIDSKLQEAFEGDKPVAVIHRLEELPPGSTLIFYRYCDHESAAYKRAFLLFTVLLPQDELTSKQSLKEVEEMVQVYVKERLVTSSSQMSFNEMDTDKYGGLWSRISHLILPVVSEKEVEQKGCRS